MCHVFFQMTTTRTPFTGFEMGPRTVMARVAGLSLARAVLTKSRALLRPALQRVEDGVDTPDTLVVLQQHAANAQVRRAEHVLSTAYTTIVKCQRIGTTHALDCAAVSLRRELTRVHALRRRLTAALKKTQRPVRRIPKKGPLDCTELVVLRDLLGTLS